MSVGESLQINKVKPGVGRDSYCKSDCISEIKLKIFCNEDPKSVNSHKSSMNNLTVRKGHLFSKSQAYRILPFQVLFQITHSHFCRHYDGLFSKS